MAIYKLGEISIMCRGGGKFQKKDLKKTGEFLALHYGKTYKCELVDESFPHKVDKKFYHEKSVINQSTVLVSTSETIKDLGHSYFINSSIYGILGGEQISIKGIENFIIDKFLFYLIKKNKNKFHKYATGLKVFRIKIVDIREIIFNVPSLEEQQNIIDIIEPIESLFLKFSQCVRIDTFDNTKKDLKNIIDIIEPIEKIESYIIKIINLIKNYLVSYYNSINTEEVFFYDIITLQNNKWNEQSEYIATNAIGEFSIDLNKIIDINSIKPSRADVSPANNSFIISKLLGENKVFYFSKAPEEVFSTGFFNFQTLYNDQIAGFLMSKHFKEQKEKLSSGTTMQAINLSNLKLIKMKKPLQYNEQNIVDKIEKLISIKNKLNLLKERLIKLLIK
ncbi:restriction endonuclease [Spiroplasma sabaudiense Ar-1343]|uniref:Restriction endonuclease n=1 Tax=Spiroplasma sabaudiense Ar-1343 TaxID=1276257 RepID=W6AAG0_9MOLU|nr:restriction endonuclease subunit S [Spiroplasma sabaudiense]AHI53830.1 restriction endonuclease [Spiroplasma sabaudiense Ar-1343]